MTDMVNRIIEDTVSKQVQILPVQTDLSAVIITVHSIGVFLYRNVLHVLTDRGALVDVYS